MLNYVYIGLVFIFFYSGEAISQDYTIDTVPVFEIVNEDFEKLLTDFILCESQYGDLGKTTSFDIMVIDTLGYVFELMACPTNVTFEEAIHSDYYRNSYPGVFYFHDYIFFMAGRGRLCSNIIKKTKKYINVKYKIEIQNDSSRFLYIEEDDSFFPTQWSCIIENNKIQIVNKQKRSGSNK